MSRFIDVIHALYQLSKRDKNKGIKNNYTEDWYKEQAYYLNLKEESENMAKALIEINEQIDSFYNDNQSSLSLARNIKDILEREHD